MKKRWVCPAVFLVLTAAICLGCADVLTDEPAERSKGYWKLVGVSKEFFHSYEGMTDMKQSTQRVIMNSGARFSLTKETPSGTGKVETLFTWDIPESTYRAGDPVTITLGAEVLEFTDKADVALIIGPQRISARFRSGPSHTPLLRQGQVNTNLSMNSSAMDVSSRFPRGIKGDRMSLQIYISDLGAVNYLYEFMDEPEFDVSQAEGWWELMNVEIKELPEYPYVTYSVSRGMATKYVYFEPFWGNHEYALQHMSFFWTEPRQRYLPGQYADINFSLSLDQYVDNGRMPRAGDWMAVGGLGFKDDKGRWNADVAGSGGIITKGSDSLRVSALLPKGETGYTLAIDVHSQSFGHVVYHYQWQEDQKKTE